MSSFKNPLLFLRNYLRKCLLPFVGKMDFRKQKNTYFKNTDYMGIFKRLKIALCHLLSKIYCQSLTFLGFSKLLNSCDYFFLLKGGTNPFNPFYTRLAKIIVKYSIFLFLYIPLYYLLQPFDITLFKKAFKYTIINPLAIGGKKLAYFISAFIITNIICHNNVLLHHHLPMYGRY